MENEIWLNIHFEEYKDLYLVSNMGRIKISRVIKY